MTEVQNDRYQQLKKNTVSARGQLKENDHVLFENPHGTGVRIMFVGNSITLHGVCHEIGWHNAWGMAASAKEKDYVHLVMESVKEKDPDAAFCVCQISLWENHFQTGYEEFHLFESAREFGAQIMVVRLIENCPVKDFDPEVFKNCLAELISWLDASGNAAVILTDGFWHHPGDSALEEFARQRQLPFVKLGDLGEMTEMKAIGLFDHGGVANHPGDLGMEKIAQRIWAALQKLL